MVGASLSESHTSVTALHTCVCMSACLLVAIYRKFQLNEQMFKFAHVLKQIHVQWTNSRRWKRLRTMTDKGRLFTDGAVKSRTVVEFASGKGHE